MGHIVRQQLPATYGVCSVPLRRGARVLGVECGQFGTIDLVAVVDFTAEPVTFRVQILTEGVEMGPMVQRFIGRADVPNHPPLYVFEHYEEGETPAVLVGSGSW